MRLRVVLILLVLAASSCDAFYSTFPAHGLCAPRSLRFRNGHAATSPISMVLIGGDVDISSLKYRELQHLAKVNGIKANLPVSSLGSSFLHNCKSFFNR